MTISSLFFIVEIFLFVAAVFVGAGLFGLVFLLAGLLAEKLFAGTPFVIPAQLAFVLVFFGVFNWLLWQG